MQVEIETRTSSTEPLPLPPNGGVKERRAPTGKTKSLWIHPLAGWLNGQGLVAQKILSIPGEIVSGHPDRHVMRVPDR